MEKTQIQKSPMRRRDSSGPGAGGRKRPAGRTGGPAGRSGARSNSPRDKRSSDSSPSGKKTFSRSRNDRDDPKPRRPTKFSGKGRGDSKDFNPRGGKTFSRSTDKPGFSSPGEKPFSRSRDDRDDSKPRRSKFSDERGEDKKFSRPSGDKSFGRSKDEGFSTRGEKQFSRSRDDRDESKPKRSKFSDERGGSSRDYAKPPRNERPFDRDDKSEGKKGFFSKLSRGGKSFEKRHDRDFGKSVKDFSQQKEEIKESSEGSDKIRLNKYISNSGVCSRREADELIKMGLVAVNGTVITELGYKVNRNDVVKYDGKTLRAEKPVYILMNKPKGFLTTTKDPQERNTVMQIIAGAVKERVYPVGRLDRNTTGLLLLTNDGELTDKLSHPSYNVKKIYKAELDKPLTKTDFQKILEGIQLEEGRAMVDDLAIVSDDGKTVGLQIHIGWNRVIRRIFERLDYQVVKLDRSVYAGLDKKDLGRGHWRFLTQEEVVRLKHYK